MLMVTAMRFLPFGTSTLIICGCLVTFPPPADTDSQRATATDTESGVTPACVRYVDSRATTGADGTSWEKALTTVEQGIAAASKEIASAGQCEVWIASGTYHVSQLELASMVSVYGGFVGNEETRRADRDPFVHPTVLSGCLDQACIDGAEHVVIGKDNALLSSVVISGGRSTTGGAGVLCNGVSLTLEDLVVTDNTTTADGGGLLVRGDASMTLRRVVVVHNEASGDGGGIAVRDGAQLILGNSFLSQNTAHDGGALHLTSGSTARLEKSSVCGNEASGMGGGAYVIDSELVLEGSTIASNTAHEGGGAYASGGHIAATNSALVANSGIVGGGTVGRGNAAIELYGCTMFDNESGEGGGASATVSDTGELRLVSCIVHGQGKDDVLFSGSSMQASYCVVRDALAGQENRPIDPHLRTDVATAKIEKVSHLAGRGIAEFILEQPLSIQGISGFLLHSALDLSGTFAPVLSMQGNTVRIVGSYSEFSEGATVALWDLSPAAGSPCLDAGHGTLSPPTDLREQERFDVKTIADLYTCQPNETTCISYADIGAVEWRP